MEPAPFELFYVIADTACAEARKAVLALPPAQRNRITFRNTHYPEAAHDHATRGGTQVPALWDGRVLHQGLPAIVALLASWRE
jgi:hypothetical protein